MLLGSEGTIGVITDVTGDGIEGLAAELGKMEETVLVRVLQGPTH